MNWTSRPTTAVSTVVGPSHSTRTFRCTHCALFRGPSHPAALVKALAHGPARRCERPGRRNGPGGVPHVLSPCAMRAVGIEPCLSSCRELRPPKSGGRVMFGRCQTCLDHRSEPISGANDER